MLSNVDVQPTLAVRNLSRARPFYEPVLALRPVGPAMPTVQRYLSGRTVLVVYESEFAGTNKATAVTWPLGNAFAKIIADLKAKGAQFEHYDMPGMTLEGDAHVGHGRRLARSRTPRATSSILATSAEIEGNGDEAIRSLPRTTFDATLHQL